MHLKADFKGFLIADGPGVDAASMARGIEVVHGDGSAILALLRGGARSASATKRQRVASLPHVMTARFRYLPRFHGL